jgi:hypothetical protein
MKARSKFYGIKFPLFGLKVRPHDYSVKLDSIHIKRTEDDDWHLIDKFKENASLISRYVAAKDDFFVFDYTCLNTTQLLTRNIQWGIDASAKIYDLKNKQKFKARTVKVTKVKNNLIWLDTISYPFKLNKNVLDTSEIMNQYITVVYVDECWHLYKFSSFDEGISEIKI